MIKKVVSIIGAGLAGCEAALWLSENSFDVTIYDGKPKKLDAYHLDTFAELVCNNSFGSRSLSTPLGLLINELNLCGSKLIKIANECRVDDTKFFAVDKRSFSEKVTLALKSNGVNIKTQYIENLPEADNLIIATGPLTSDKLIENISKKYDISSYHFSDASSIIIDIRSIDLKNNFIEKVSDDLYEVFIPDTIFVNFSKTLREAKSFKHKIDESFEFDKCLSIERLAKLGNEILKKSRFTYENKKGAYLLLRRENALENGFIMVGCITALPHQEQRKAISILPGFLNCKIIKYGRMHRNSFFNSPQSLDNFYRVKNSNTYIIGQLSGIDGYVPAISSGLVAALKIMYGDDLKPFPRDTMIGGLANYVSNYNGIDFQPMCASLALLSPQSENAIEKSEESIKKYKQYLQTLNRII